MPVLSPGGVSTAGDAQEGPCQFWVSSSLPICFCGKAKSVIRVGLGEAANVSRDAVIKNSAYCLLSQRF